ncbi:MAG: gamma carbonic anhydrase family protein [bacterium]
MIYSLPGRVPRIPASCFVAPSADIIGAVTLGEHASVWFNAVLRGDNDAIAIGARSNVQDGAVLHVDPGVAIIIEDEVTVGHSAMLHGCAIGAGTLVGVGSRVLNGAVVGAHCLIGANTLITEGKTFPPHSLILGAPGKVLRELSDHEVETVRGFADAYVRKIERYRQLRPIDS